MAEQPITIRRGEENSIAPATVRSSLLNSDLGDVLINM